FESVAGESYSGGVYWRYIDNTTVRARVFQSGSTVAVDQTAYYIEDSWNITDNFVAYPAPAGIRSRTRTAKARPTSRSRTSSLRAWASRGTCSATPASRSSVTPAATRCR